MLRFHEHSLRHGPQRESHQLEDWLMVHCGGLLADVGLAGLWWCGINLPRKGVFGDMGGDIDVIAGPIGLTITEHELGRFVAEEDRCRPDAPENYNLNAALHRAARAGLLKWPPQIGETVVLEVKSSYFENSKWRSTHAGELSKILGSLKKRLELGVNAVVFMHLGVVAPATDANDLDQIMNEAAATFPLFDVNEFGGFGYVTGLMGGMATDGTFTCGKIDRPKWLRLPVFARPAGRPWHDKLRARLGDMAPPSFPRTFVHACADCKAWRNANSPNPDHSPCACRLGDETLKP